MSSAIATFPRKELFARITESIQRWGMEALSKGTEYFLWQCFIRMCASRFGAEIEIELKDIARLLNKAFRTTYRAFKSLVAKGFCKITRTLSGYGYRVVLLVPEGCEVDQNCAATLPVLSHLGHSNPHSTVTSIRDLREKQTGELSLENSPSQKEGLRSLLPKPKPRNQEPELEPEPELTEALGLIAEYGNRTGDRNLETKSRVRSAIANIARNLSPEKLIERVRNAIAATEERRLIGGVESLEGFLSSAIAKGFTSNASKKLAAEAAAEPTKSLGSWLKEVCEVFPDSIYQLDRQGVNVIYRCSDQAEIGTFEDLRDLPIEEIGRLINPPAATNEAPSEKNREFREGNRQPMPDRSDNSPKINPEFSDRISKARAECQVIRSENVDSQIANPTPHEPTEDELSDANSLRQSYEQDLGITPGDRVATIRELIGVNVTHSNRLTDSQLVDYVGKLKQLVDKALRRSHESTANPAKNH